MISVAALRTMAAAGMTTAEIIDAIERDREVDEARAFVASERRRELDRERQRRCRMSRKSRVTTVTSDQPIQTAEEFRRDIENEENGASLSKNLTSIGVLKKKESKGVARAREAVTRDRGARLPDDWLPDADGQTLAWQTLGQWAYRELEKFRDHWKAQPGSRGIKRDWDATWRNWVRRASEYGNKGSNGHGRKRTVSEVADAFIAELDDKIRREEAEAGDGAGQSSLGLLFAR